MNPNISVIGSHEFWLRNQKIASPKKSFNNLDGCFCFFSFVGQLVKYRKIKIPSDSPWHRLNAIHLPDLHVNHDGCGKGTGRTKPNSSRQTWQCLSLQRRKVQWEKDVGKNYRDFHGFSSSRNDASYKKKDYNIPHHQNSINETTWFRMHKQQLGSSWLSSASASGRLSIGKGWPGIGQPKDAAFVW